MKSPFVWDYRGDYVIREVLCAPFAIRRSSSKDKPHGIGFRVWAPDELLEEGCDVVQFSTWKR